VKQWQERFQIDASGDETCGLAGHGLVAVEMKAAFGDITPRMIVEATQGLDAERHGLSPADKPAQFPRVLAFRTARDHFGVLEIHGFSDDRKVVKFRYKMVEAGEVVEPPASAPPPELLAEIQRESVQESIHNLLFKTPAMASAAWPIGRPTADYFDRVAQEPRVTKILKAIREGAAAQQEAVRHAVLRECTVYVERLPDRGQVGEPWSPSVTDPGGGVALPLLLCYCDPRGKSLPIMVAMFERFQKVAQKQHERGDPVWVESQAGVFWAYACQHFLDRMAADPQWQTRLKPEEVRVLDAYRHYREAAKPLGQFLYQLEMMRFASDLVAAVQPPTPVIAELVEEATFDSLTIQMNDHWLGRRSIAIQGDGTYAFDLKDYHTTYQLKPEHVRRLEELLKATDWLTMAAERHAPVTDATTYTLTLERGGRETTVATTDVQENTYKELIRFTRRIERQEVLLRGTTIPEHRNSVAYELKSELDALAGRPVVKPYAPVLDYYRLVPTFIEWLAKPRGQGETAIEATAELVTFLNLQSERPKLEAIAWGHVPGDPEYESAARIRIIAVRALGRLGCRQSLSVLESQRTHNDVFVRHTVAEALLSAPPTAAIPILKEMTADTRPAAWTLIQLGAEAESAIIEILQESDFRSSAPGHVIREYYEHWNELPAPPSAAIVEAIYDRVQAEAGRSGLDQYGLEVLKLAGQPFVVRNVWQDLETVLALIAAKDRTPGKELVLEVRLHRSERAPEAFLKAAEAGNLEIRRILADRTSALAHATDRKSQSNYVLWLNRVGVVWSVWVVWDVPADKVQGRLDGFLKDHPQAKAVRPDNPPPT